MFLVNGKKERERYYLLPGMGGQASRRKQRKYLKWAAVASVVFSVLMALVMYWLNRARPLW
jgi:hypothetical protein